MTLRPQLTIADPPQVWKEHRRTLAVNLANWCALSGTFVALQHVIDDVKSRGLGQILIFSLLWISGVLVISTSLMGLAHSPLEGLWPPHSLQGFAPLALAASARVDVSLSPPRIANGGLLRFPLQSLHLIMIPLHDCLFVGGNSALLCQPHVVCQCAGASIILPSLAFCM